MTQSVGTPECRKPTLRLKAYCNTINIQNVSDGFQHIIGELSDNEVTVNIFPKIKMSSCSISTYEVELHWTHAIEIKQTNKKLD